MTGGGGSSPPPHPARTISEVISIPKSHPAFMAGLLARAGRSQKHGKKIRRVPELSDSLKSTLSLTVNPRGNFPKLAYDRPGSGKTDPSSVSLCLSEGRPAWASLPG